MYLLTLCPLFLLLMCATAVEGVVTPTSLPPSIQNCYNNYASTTLRDVVGESFCDFCEEKNIESMTPLFSVLEDPESASYIEELVSQVNALKERGRVKRQIEFPPCVRKEYRMMTDFERNRFHNGLNALKASGRYDILARLHSGAVIDSAHDGPNFLGWHRVYVLIMENALRNIDPEICMPYWNSALDNELPNPRGSFVFSSTFLGGRQNGPVMDPPFAGWRMPWGVPLIRNVGVTGQLYTAESIRNILRQRRTRDIVPPTGNLNNGIEFNHNGVHNFIGGQMSRLQTAAFDPVFFLHHTFVDYIWEVFRNQQRARGLNPETDYPVFFGSSLHAPGIPLGLGFNLTARDGYLNSIGAAARYDPSPTCNRLRPDCGSRYLQCNVQRRICIPIVPATLCTGPGCRLPRAIRNPSDPSLPVPPEPCMNDVLPIQNDYCIDGKCDIRQWVYVTVAVIAKRPPGYSTYHSYPIVNGQVIESHDIYKPISELFTQQNVSYPKTYDKCKSSSEVGQVIVEASGFNYYGYYEESALVDHRLATSMSLGYVAVKNPRNGTVKALFRAFDTCGRLCKPACRVPGSKALQACSGAMEISHVPGRPDQYSYSYGQANVETWDLDVRAEFPSLDDDNIPITFYCDYSDQLPWKSASRQSQPSTSNYDPTKECLINQDCVLPVPCRSGTCILGDSLRCRGSCSRYAECVFGQYQMKTCPPGYSFDPTLRMCSRLVQCVEGQNPSSSGPFPPSQSQFFSGFGFSLNGQRPSFTDTRFATNPRSSQSMNTGMQPPSNKSFRSPVRGFPNFIGPNPAMQFPYNDLFRSPGTLGQSRP